jgi:hypothetical protein
MPDAPVRREYRIVLRRTAESDGDLSPPQFTVIVEATDSEDALSKAGDVADLLQGRFVVAEIRPSEPYWQPDRHGRG